MYSVDVPLLSVTHVFQSTCFSVSTLTRGEEDGSSILPEEAVSESLGTRFVLSRNRIVAPFLYFANSRSSRSRSDFMPSRTTSVPMGQSSMSSVVRVPLSIKPISGRSVKVAVFFLRGPEGPSKCGVSLVR
ncbi:hypothetical protein RRF57_009930 [Xylaria bambusicola]|uniref:Uncharacterized protein n=1 Tax=Xylaria bambusicola TaxID=326684 RepID=A0AAN7UWH6_9PEZI